MDGVSGASNNSLLMHGYPSLVSILKFESHEIRRANVLSNYMTTELEGSLGLLTHPFMTLRLRYMHYDSNSMLHHCHPKSTSHLVKHFAIFFPFLNKFSL